MTIKIDANAYDAITFDCYGTLIDWEAGLMSYIQPLLEAHDAHAVAEFPARLLRRAPKANCRPALIARIERSSKAC